uniref:Uncharacterized protein n=1 Tax=Brassica campestris TaxID=3711 RepID=A0A3P5YIR6_BRACM|nr:unnamed protein product [Brassica rapa]
MVTGIILPGSHLYHLRRTLLLRRGLIIIILMETFSDCFIS